VPRCTNVLSICPLQGQYTLSTFLSEISDKVLRKRPALSHPSSTTMGQDEMYFVWSHRLTVRTSGFHPGNRSSILRGITATHEKTKQINCLVFSCRKQKALLSCRYDRRRHVFCSSLSKNGRVRGGSSYERKRIRNLTPQYQNLYTPCSFLSLREDQYASRTKQRPISPVTISGTWITRLASIAEDKPRIAQ
jgi:hypothetical protein